MSEITRRYTSTLTRNFINNYQALKFMMPMIPRSPMVCT